MKKKACILLNGEYAEHESLITLAGSDALVIGVDGGTCHLADFGLKPHIIIGDMDSLQETELARFVSQGVQILRHPPEKDETDFELALEQAIIKGCSEILVIGALGGRSDQMIANLLLPIAYLDKGEIRLLHGAEEITYINSCSNIHGNAGDIISLIPVSGDVTGVNTTGLRYPLNFETLYLGKSRGVSNELTGTSAIIAVSSGILLCIHTHLTHTPR
jgi:thiamine pyrophosphokinase